MADTANWYKTALDCYRSSGVAMLDTGDFRVSEPLLGQIELRVGATEPQNISSLEQAARTVLSRKAKEAQAEWSAKLSEDVEYLGALLSPGFLQCQGLAILVLARQGQYEQINQAA